MHGGAIYIQENLKEYQLGEEAGLNVPNNEEEKLSEKYIFQFAHYFIFLLGKILTEKFTPLEMASRNAGFLTGFVKLYPKYLRPYGRLYAY